MTKTRRPAYVEPVVDTPGAHRFDDYLDRCQRCGASRHEIDDAIAPPTCTGSPAWRTAWKELAAMTADRDLWKALAKIRGGYGE